MNLFRISLTLIAIISSSSTYADEALSSIQRYRFIGSAEDGKKVIILLSHFGPSSQAPFVNLILKEVGKPSTEIIDSKFMFSGGEKELKELEALVLKENEHKLKTLGFTSAQPEFVPAFWEGSSFEKAPHKIYVDTQRNEEFKTLFSTSVATRCPDEKPGLEWKTCLESRCSESIVGPPYSCLTLSLSHKEIVKIGKIYWTVVYRKTRMLDPQTAAGVEFAGLELLP